ncbi:MFS general substrate transporter [Durotheca rogersii]|uniref:MFS general substrate transporter n=1 Tax=Durotheca rogersii TaxID=419775 RepID=UPI00221E5511|nr:MFS general substrate transporter [Durotheca rogersii]KAI5868401.1 MFS general substrate transporter [Durotheca rogersii]
MSSDRLQQPDPHAFPTKQLTILAICRFSEPIAFNSILAYTYVMVTDLQGGDDTDASFYAGLLVSAYAAAEALTAIGWGALSDRYGRKPVVLFGLGGVALSSLIFGLATEYWVALLARFIGGALNGNVAVMQTMVAEMVKVPEHEPAAYATQPFVWTLGGIIGSAMGGFLAQPAVFYPSVFAADGLFGRYPYLLPNLVSVVAIALAIVQGALFLEETNPPREPRPDDALVFAAAADDDDERAPLCRREIPGADAVEPTFDLRRPEKPPAAPRTFNSTIVMVTVALVLVSYHQMAFGTLLPTHLLDRPARAPGRLDLVGGLGYTVHDVGVYLSVNGLLGLFVQGVVFPAFVGRVGVWASFAVNVALYPLAYLLMPFLSAAPRPLVAPGVYLSMALQSFFGIIALPCALILLKDATPDPRLLGRVNGLAMSACCLARTVSPPLVGSIYSARGSAAAWLSCAAVAAIGVAQLPWVPRKHVPDAELDGNLETAARKTASGLQDGGDRASPLVAE